MNEEEKKAIKYIKEFKNETKERVGNKSTMVKNLNILLKLINKQQKEIDELIKKYEMKKVLFVRKDHNTKELLSELYIRKDTLDTDYISKDKIRAKIKEYDKWIEKGEYIESLEAQRYALKELLEE